jgi:hypothetical protein
MTIWIIVALLLGFCIPAIFAGWLTNQELHMKDST